jgi:hypothetical protein
LLRLKNRAFELVCGTPRLFTVAFENCRLCAEGVNGIAPWIAPARLKSAEVARIRLFPLTAARPKSPDRMLVTPLLNLALR